MLDRSLPLRFKDSDRGLPRVRTAHVRFGPSIKQGARDVRGRSRSFFISAAVLPRDTATTAAFTNALNFSGSSTIHSYEVRRREDRRGFDLISDALPFRRLWYGGPNALSNAIGYAKHRSRSHDAVIRVYDDAGNLIETYEHKGDFREW
jgi:hypothetical protein